MGGRGVWLAAGGVALVVAALYGIAVSGWGLGLSQDSFYYLHGAAGIARGEGLVTEIPEGTARPITLWPPAYALLIAPGGVWPLVLNGLLYVALAVGVLLALHWAGTGLRVATVSALVAAFGGGVLTQFAMLLSEALFLPLLLATIALTARALHDPRRRWLVAAGLCAAAAMLTRYAGLGVAAGCVVALLAASRGDWRRGAGRAGLFALAAVPPVALWMLRNWLIADTATERAVALHTPALGWFADLWRVMTLWFAPAEFSRWVRHPLLIALILAALPGVLRLLRGPGLDRRRALAWAAITGGAGYLALMFATQFATTRGVDMDLRMLLPLFLCAVLLAGLAASALPARFALPVLIVLAVGGGVRSAVDAAHVHREGAGYSGRAWRDALELEVAADVALASNHPEAVAHTLGRPCFKLPSVDPAQPRRLDPARVARLHALVGGRRGLVLLFTERAPWQPPDELLVRELALQPIAQSPAVTTLELPAR